MNNNWSIYKKHLLTISNHNQDLAITAGLIWIKDNLDKEFKIVNVNYKDLIQKLVYNVESHLFSAGFCEAAEEIRTQLDNSNKSHITIAMVIDLDYHKQDSLDELCKIISDIRSYKEERAILKDFK